MAKLRGWVMEEVVGMSLVNARPVTRVTGPPEMLEQLVDAYEHGYWQCAHGHVRTVHDPEYIKSKFAGGDAEYMPEICGVGDCRLCTTYHEPLKKKDEPTCDRP